MVTATLDFVSCVQNIYGMQLTKAYEVKTTYNQVVVDSATYVSHPDQFAFIIYHACM